MNFSKRIQAIPGSPTVALNAKTMELQRSGVDVINFTVGEPDYPTPDIVVEAGINALRQGRTKYGSPGGGLPLRESIAKKFKTENNLTFHPDEIVAGVGAKEILFHLCLGLLNEGDAMMVTAPYWVSYTAHAQAAGAESIVVPTPTDFPKTRLDMKAIATAWKPNIKVFMLNSPNNPAGYVLSKDELAQLGAFLRDKDCWIISDEIYEYLTFDGDHLSLLNVCPDLKDRFILVHGVAKNFAMTGWRVGFACAPLPVAKMMRNLQSQSSTSLPPFVEDAAAKAFELGRPLVQMEMVVMKRRRELASSLIQTIPDIVCPKPDGAFYLFIDFRKILGRGTTPKTSMELAQVLLEKDHVALVPGEAFGSPGFIRLSYTCSEKKIQEGIERIKKAVSRMADS
jgi:aspartate aminotransferase